MVGEVFPSEYMLAVNYHLFINGCQSQVKFQKNIRETRRLLEKQALLNFWFFGKFEFLQKKWIFGKISLLWKKIWLKDFGFLERFWILENFFWIFGKKMDFWKFYDFLKKKIGFLLLDFSGLKPSKLKNYHIFGKPRTSAFSWYTPFRSYWWKSLRKMRFRFSSFHHK